MDAATLGQWGAILLALGGAWVAYKKAPSERRVLDAQAQDFVSQAAARLIDDLEGQLDRCQKYAQRLKQEHGEEKAQLRATIVELQDENERLHHRLVYLETKGE